MRLPFLRRRAALPRLPALGKAADRPKSFWHAVFWGTSDGDGVANRISEVAERIAEGVHFGDNLLTWARNNSMLDDEAFVSAWQTNAESEADKAIVWRRYILACAAYHCIHLEGDFVECGAYTGVGVKTVVDYLGGAQFPKRFWAYDLFEHDKSMLHHAMPELGAGLYERVKRKFEAYPQVTVVKGNIPEVFQQQSPAAIAYLHIDLNQAPAELAALEAFFDRISPGGIVILDDYEWGGPYRAQKLAEDPWFEARRHRVFPLPTGQGLVIKRPPNPA
jgi:hypothetical protein